MVALTVPSGAGGKGLGKEGSIIDGRSPVRRKHDNSSVVCTVPTSDVGKHWAIEIVLRFSYLEALNEAEIDVSDYRL